MIIEKISPIAISDKDRLQNFSPEGYLIGALRSALTRKQDIKIRSQKFGNIICLGTRNEYVSDSTDLESLLGLPAEHLSIMPLSAEDIPATDHTRRCAMELMWTVAFHSSSGQLMEGCHFHDVAQLVSWPNLTRLPVTPNTFRILALLSHRPTSVFFAARLLKIPQAEMNQVYSALRAAGHIKVINVTGKEREILPHRSRTFLSSLLDKIARRR